MMPLFAVTIFLSAFLLFLVQPLIARMILPWFGGTAAVWTTCLMFFQTVLLLGYLYANCVVRYVKPKSQALVHIALLAASLFALPILPGAHWRPSPGEPPTYGILALLVVTVGAPYLLLSSTGPLLQAWYARFQHARFQHARFQSGAAPYRWYALSNAGSLLALLGFPFWIEPTLRSSRQAYGWSGLYLLFALLCAGLAWRVKSAPALPLAVGASSSADASPGERGIWVALAFCPSVLLLAMTAHLSQNIAPIPLLWIVPLSVYLLSLILCFDSGRWYRRRPWLLTFLVFTGGTGYALQAENANVDIRILIPLLVLCLFCSCMVCHGELARRKPAAQWLTSFYLMVALGGALGGLFAGLLAPLLFRSYLELRMGLLACVALISVLLYRESEARGSNWFLPVQLGSAGIMLMLAYQLTIGHYQWIRAQRLVVRNFYGQLLVRDKPATEDEPASRDLLHGTILHGSQYVSTEYRRRPSTYYCESSGAGRALRNRNRAAAVRVGVIGLGVGTLAAYGRAGDVFRFYEINPLVREIARSQFTYLQDCPAKLDVVLGDARRSLEEEAPQHFDLLVVDAFSGDAIPVHLLTQEAFREYFRHLKPDGILAIHISNRYLNLQGVVELEAEYFHQSSLLVVDPAEDDEICSKSDWMLVSGNPRAFEGEEWKGLGKLSPPSRGLTLWTDDYSNLLYALKKPEQR